MYGLVKVVGDDSLRQAKYILIESKKGSVDIRANLLKLGLEINEGRKAEIFYIDGNTKERVYVWSETPYVKLNRETKKGLNMTLNNNAVELGDALERIIENSKCDANIAKKKISK